MDVNALESMLTLEILRASLKAKHKRCPRNVHRTHPSPFCPRPDTAKVDMGGVPPIDRAPTSRRLGFPRCLGLGWTRRRLRERAGSEERDGESSKQSRGSCHQGGQAVSLALLPVHLSPLLLWSFRDLRLWKRERLTHSTGSWSGLDDCGSVKM